MNFGKKIVVLCHFGNILLVVTQCRNSVDVERKRRERYGIPTCNKLSGLCDVTSTDKKELGTVCLFVVRQSDTIRFRQRV